MAGIDQQRQLSPQELANEISRAAREVQEGAKRNVIPLAKELSTKGVVERARNSAPINPDPLYEISPDGIAQMIRQPRTPEEQQAANDIFKARGDNDMARIRQIVDAINRVPLQEVDTRTPEQIQADYEYARNMHAPAGIRKKETPVNIPRQTDTQIKVGFKPSMGGVGSESPKGSIGIDRNGNGRINSIVNGVRVSASGQGNSARGPGAENIAGGVGG